MPLAFTHTVSALCYSIVLDQESAGRPEAANVSTNAVVNFVLDQHARMPDYMRLPLTVVTVLFDIGGLTTSRTLFHRMRRPDRRRHIEAWRSSRFSLARDFVRLYESLAIFAWYSMLDPRIRE